MNKNKYTLNKAFNFIKLLFSRPIMHLNLVKLRNYHLANKVFSFQETTEILLKKILHYSINHSTYYKELFEKHNININNINDFAKIPFLDKEIIKLNIKALQSNRLIRDTNYIMNTGGTTGTPMSFPVSSHYDDLHQKFAFNLMGYCKGDIIIAVDGSDITERLKKKKIFWKNKAFFRRRAYGKIAFSALYLTEETVKYYVDQLIVERPAFLRGYPSAINYIAIYLIDNEINLPFKLKGVQLTAETIFEDQVANICKAFKCRVQLQYGHSEVSIYAYTIDESYEYFCSPFYGFTEIIGTCGKHVDVGEIGEVVVTGFYNKAMPFIRYKTGDLALYSGTFDGIVRLKHVYGRNQDFVYDEFGKKVFLIGLIYGGHHEFLNHIKKWQIIQNQYGSITIKIIAGNSFTALHKKAIEDLFLNINNIVSTICIVDKIELTNRGKTKFVIQNA